MIHLIVHFDINETILIGDDAGGDTYEQCIHKIIAKSAFVQVQPPPQQQPNVVDDDDDDDDDTNNDTLQVPILPSNNPTSLLPSVLSYEQRKDLSNVVPSHWWDGTLIRSATHTDTDITNGSHNSSSGGGGGGDDDDDDDDEEQRRVKQSAHESISSSSSSSSPPPQSSVVLWTQWEWPYAACPYYRTSYKKQCDTFANHDGYIYHHSHYQTIYQQMHPNRFDQCNNHHPVCDVPTTTTTKTRKTMAQMLPAFFDTVMELNEWCNNKSIKINGSSSSSSNNNNNNNNQNKKNIHHITIVLRTFGTDLDHVMNAIQLFVSGQHPEYSFYDRNQRQQQLEGNIRVSTNHAVKGRWIPRQLPKTTTTDDHQNHSDGSTTRTTTAHDNDDSNNDTNEQPHHNSYEYQLLDDTDTIIASGDDNVVQWLHTVHRTTSNHHNNSSCSTTAQSTTRPPQNSLNNHNHYHYHGDDDDNNNQHNITICGIQDDYDHWSKHECVPWAGKPVWKLLPRQQQQPPPSPIAPVPSSLSSSSSTITSQRLPSSNDVNHIDIAKTNRNETIQYHHVLFDDNIHNLEHTSIACVREEVIMNVTTEEDCVVDNPDCGTASIATKRCTVFRTLSGMETLQEQGNHLIRVPTIEPIFNRRWFIEQIERLLQEQIPRATTTTSSNTSNPP